MTAAQKRRHVERLIAEAQHALWLDAHEILLTIATKACRDDEEGSNTDAECVPNFPYLNARVTIYPCFFTHEPERQRQIIRHELAHIIAAHSRELTRRAVRDQFVTAQEIKDANERLTDHIARIAGGRP